MLTTLPHLSLATASKISSQAKVKLQAAPEHHKPQLFRLTMIYFDFSAVVPRMSLTTGGISISNVITRATFVGHTKMQIITL